MNFYNLIILDRSGSMTTIRNKAVAGVNETLGTIKAFARENADTRQYVTLLSFCGCKMDYSYSNTPIERVGEFTREMYEPCCSTPLYDAIGGACSKLLALTAGDNDARVSVTIITDGYENASREWNHGAIAKLIGDLKEKGWLFAYIGADHDVEKTAISINIDNHLTFTHDEEGTEAMFVCENSARKEWMSAARSVECPNQMKSINKNFFKRGR